MFKKISMLALVALSTGAAADFRTGGMLHEDLTTTNTNNSTMQMLFGTGYIIGVADALSGHVICMPDGATVTQAKQIVTRYVADHPQHWDKPASASVVEALSTAWPCE